MIPIQLVIIIIACGLFYAALYRMFVVPAKKLQKKWDEEM